MADEPEIQHGPQAGYSGGPGEPYFQPFIDCLCGWSSGRVDSFEMAGELFDAHIKEQAGREK